MNKVVLLLLAVVLSLTLCCKGTDETKEARIDHVVFFWMAEDSDSTLLDSIKHHSAMLDTIPGIISLSYGDPIMSDRPIVDDSFDLGLIFTFSTEKEMNSYLTHEGHTSFLKKWIKPHGKRVLVYDIKRN